MNRRTFGLAVRLLAVVAAIYAFFSLRSQLPKEQTSRGPIPVKVVNQNVCGQLTVIAVSQTEITGVEVPIELNPIIVEALKASGKSVPVRFQGECVGLAKLNGTVVLTDQGSYKIEFRKI